MMKHSLDDGESGALAVMKGLLTALGVGFKIGLLFAENEQKRTVQ